MDTEMPATSAPPPAVLLDLLTWENPVLRQFAFWTSILIVKMLLMSFATGYQRYRAKVLVNIDESIVRNNRYTLLPSQSSSGEIESIEGSKVERVRR